MTAHNRAYTADHDGEPQLITSPHNAAVKRVRALHSRKERERSGLAFTEGIRQVVEAAAQPAVLETLLVAPELLTSALARDLVREQRAAGVPCLYVSAAVFGTLASRERPQGLGAVVRQRWHKLDQLARDDQRRWDQSARPGYRSIRAGGDTREHGGGIYPAACARAAGRIHAVGAPTRDRRGRRFWRGAPRLPGDRLPAATSVTYGQRAARALGPATSAVRSARAHPDGGP
jgi:hypothetical protein